jgi:hypothetical protein
MFDWLGGLLGYKATKDTNVASAQQAQQQMAFQKASTQKQMDFQKEMSNTAVQRRMRDLRKAGINPILAGSREASSPAGASSAGAQAPMQNPTSSAIAAARQKQELNNLDAQWHATEAQAFASQEQAKLNASSAYKLKGEMAKAKVDEQYYKSTFGRNARFVELAGNAAKPVAAAIGGAVIGSKLKGAKGFKPAQFNRKTGEIK